MNDEKDLSCATDSNVVTEDELKEEKKEEVKETKKEVKNKLKEENKRLILEVQTLKDELLRNRAELENFKKRMKDEAIKDRKYASIGLINNLLIPLEYLDKACNFETDSVELKNFLIGFQMINKQLYQVLEADGLCEIIANENDDFDPNLHHALEKEHVEGIEPNKILKVLSKGYKYKDRIIKPVMVKVSE